MEHKVKKFGITLGLGTIGYWLFQEFRKSDGTFVGACTTVESDLRSGFKASKNVARRILKALRAGASNWQTNSELNQPFSAPMKGIIRGNGSQNIQKARPPVVSGEVEKSTPMHRTT